MFYGSAEEKKDHIMEKVANMRTAAAQVNRVKEVVRQFDGKVYNKKFDDAIAALTDDDYRFYSYNQYGWFYIQFCPRHTSYNATLSIMTAYSCKADDYIKMQTREECKVFDGKRINAAAMIERLNTERAALLKEAFELETAARDIEKTLEQISALKHAVNGIIDALPWPIRDTYGIKAC
jgi:hypothetical protein